MVATPVGVDVFLNGRGEGLSRRGGGVGGVVALAGVGGVGFELGGLVREDEWEGEKGEVTVGASAAVGAVEAIFGGCGCGRKRGEVRG